jgi:hypothetical protein
VGGQRRRVLRELETERAGEELDGPVIVIDDDREVLKPHAGRVTRRCSRRVAGGGMRREALAVTGGA